jgi:ATP-binding cassette subfamily C protein
MIFPLKNFFFVLDYQLKKNFFICIFLMILSSFAELIGIGFIIILLDIFLGNSKYLDFFNLEYILVNFSSNNKNLSIDLVLVFFSIAFIFKILTLVINNYFEAKFISNFKRKISDKLFYNFLNRDTNLLLKKNSSIYLKNYITQIDQTATFFNCLLKISLDLILFTIFFLFLIIYNFFISLLVFILIITFLFIYINITKKHFYKWGAETSLRQSNRIQFINECFISIKNIKIFSRENYFYKKFILQNKILSKINYRLHFYNALPKNILEFFLFLIIILILIYLTKNNYNYSEIIQTLSLFILISLRLIPSTNRILGNVQQLKYLYPAFNSVLYEFNVPLIHEKQSGDEFSFKKNIRIEIENFNYEKKKPILKRIYLNIHKYQLVGIIGNSGSGKSTLIDLICGFIKSDKVKISVDKKNIFNSIKKWQSIIGYMPQNIPILNDTIRANILFGTDKRIDDKHLIELIKKTNLYTFYKKQTNGLDQIINQNGINISGGEIQRIGIARALINDPEILILDEATSALDFETENEILKEIKTLKKTTIVITHRINTLKICDYVYKIELGYIKKIKNI